MNMKLASLLIALNYLIQTIKSEDTNLTFFTKDSYNDSFFSSQISSTTCSTSFSSVNQFTGTIYQGSSKTIHYKYTTSIPHSRINVILEFGILQGTDSYRTQVLVGDNSSGPFQQFYYSSSNLSINTQCSVGGIPIDKFYRTSLHQKSLKKSFYIYIDELGSGIYQTIMSLQLNVDSCHPSCRSCTDEKETSCTTCDSSATASFSPGGQGKCVCCSGYVSENGVCVSSCTSGSYGQYLDYCIPSPNCSIWDSTNGICSTCSSSYLKWEGQCLSGSNCPSNYSNISEVCTLNIVSTFVNVQTYLKGAFFKANFSELELNKLRFQQKNFFKPHQSYSQISKCGETSLLGGFLINKKGTVINFPVYQIKNMYFQITFKLYYIDFDTKPANTGVFLIFNSLQFEIPISSFATQSNICGFEQYDIVDEYTLIYFIDGTSTNPQSILFQISNESSVADGSDIYHGYLGIRDISIIGFDCSHSNCRTCPQDICDSCADGYYIQSPNNCVMCSSQCLTCINGTSCETCGSDKFLTFSNDCQCNSNTYFDSDSLSCLNCLDTNCDVCTGPNYTDCSKCKNPMPYLLEDDNTCTDCSFNEYYINTTSDKCLKCVSNCLTCSNNICSLCKDGYYLDSSDYLCKLCSSYCLTCSTGTTCDTCDSDKFLNISNICQCNSNTYFDSSTISCLNCQDTNCDVCTGPNYIDCSKCKSPKPYLLEDDNTCTDCSFNEYYINSILGSCLKCVSNCLTCTNNICQNCKVGYYLDSSDYSCKLCSSYCQTCSTGSTCDTCDSDKFLNSSNICQCNSNTYFDSTSITCKSCQDINCDVCDGPNLSNCSLCKDPKPYLLTEDNSCTDCNFNSYYKLGGNCNKCITNCLTCENNICTLCENGYYLDPTTITCVLCQSICKTCSNGNTCDTCLSSDYYLNSEQMCQCNSHTYFDSTDFVCKTCNVACKECTGPSDSQCIECADLYFLIYPSTKRCQICPNEVYSSSSCQYCINPIKLCMLCTEVESSYVLLTKNTLVDTKQEYCLVCSCSSCDSNTYLYQQRCLDDCEQIGQNYQIDSYTNECKCKDSYPYRVLNSSTNREDCSQSNPFGFYCDSNNYCVKCNDNCNSCNETSCQICEEGYYLWYDFCYPLCFPSLNILPNKTTGKCQCDEGYTLTELDTPVDGSSYICLQIYNCLIQSSNKVLPSNFTNNLIVFDYNRNFTSSELKTFSFSIDSGSLVKDVDYKVINFSQDGNQLEVEVETEENRKIKQIQISIKSVNTQISLSNTILVSKSYCQTSSSSATLSNSFESISSNLISSDSSTSYFINLLKQFQLVCAISNFVQILPLIYLLRDYLPSSVKFGSLFGASLLFNVTPPASEITFSETETNNDSNLEFLNSTLQQFGLTSNLYNSFILVHLSVIISSLLVLFCLLFRKILSGKQHTLLLMNKILNFICAYLQSSITTSFFSITYCYNTYQTISLSVFQASMIVLYIVELTFILIQKSNEYILLNIPNVFLNINQKAKGAKSYLLISYIKKYSVVLIHLLYFNHHFISALVVSSIFFANGMYILYYRFFKTSLFNVIKVVQEMIISALFALIAYSIKLMQKINENDVISDADLQQSEKIGYVILIFILIGFLMSALIFTIRLVVYVLEVIQTIKSIKLQKQIRQKEIDDLINSYNFGQVTTKNLLSTKFRNSEVSRDKIKIIEL